jgi:predicted FMN-binding regulatory protein PaiB
MPIPDAIANDDVEAAWRTLVEQTRTGVLLTLRNGHPFGSHVPYLLGDDWARVYLHLSRLALHTQHLLEDARVSLFLAEPDKPGKTRWLCNASTCRERPQSSPRPTWPMNR